MAHETGGTASATPSLLTGGAALLLLLFLPTACGERSSNEGAVRNTTTLPEVMSLGPLADVRSILDVALSPAGDVWILNDQSPHLVVQGRDGVRLEAFGSTGDGPDDLGFPAAILEAGQDEVVVLDRDRQAVRTLTRDGREVAALPTPELATLIPRNLGAMTYGAPFKATTVAGSLITAQYPDPRAPDTAHLWNRQVVQIDLRTGRVSEVFDFRRKRDQFREEIGGASILMPIPLWAACPDGSVAQYIPFADSVSWANAAHDPVGVDAAPRPIDPEEVRTSVRGALELRMGEQGIAGAEVDQMLSTVLEEFGDEISTQAPAYVNMLCGPGSRLWLQRFSVAVDWVGRGRGWDVLDPDGTVVAGVQLPPGFQPLRFQGDVLFGVQRDSLQVERVVALSAAAVSGTR